MKQTTQTRLPGQNPDTFTQRLCVKNRKAEHFIDSALQSSSSVLQTQKKHSRVCG